MCGIVGLHLREPSLEPRLGELLTAMLGQVVERGPDSAGVAVYGDPRLSPPGHAVVSLLGVTPQEASNALPDAVVVAADATTVVHAESSIPELLATVASALPQATVIGSGRASPYSRAPEIQSGWPSRSGSPE